MYREIIQPEPLVLFYLRSLPECTNNEFICHVIDNIGLPCTTVQLNTHV